MGKKIDKAKATPWSQLQPSQVDVMTCDWLTRYERSLGLTRKRIYQWQLQVCSQLGELPWLRESTRAVEHRVTVGEQERKHTTSSLVSTSHTLI